MLVIDGVVAAAREELDQLTKPMSDDDPRRPAARLREQVDAVRAVAASHQLALELVELAGEDATLNCYRFALGLGTGLDPIR